MVLATPREFLLFTSEGELVERFLPVGFSAEIGAIGISGERLMVKAGETFYASNSEVSNWGQVEAAGPTVSWSLNRPIPTDLVHAMDSHLRGEGLPVYRIILDLHSGNFFGEVGGWIMDGAAILLLILSFSGIWIWWPRAS